MQDTQATNRREVGSATKLKFTGSTDFQKTLRARVDEFFRTTGKRPRDCWQMYLKTAILLAAFTASYGLLVFVAATWWQALPLAILLGLATAGIGFNIQHDGKHQAYSDSLPRLSNGEEAAVPLGSIRS